MLYNYKKHYPLNMDETVRVCVNQLLHDYFELGDIEHLTLEINSQHKQHISGQTEKLRRDLIQTISSPAACFDLKIFHWLLSYGTPQLILMFQSKIPEIVQSDWKAKLFLTLTKKLQIDRLLPLDFITPDLQNITADTSKNNRCLICFTGIGHRMMMPNQLFHAQAFEYFNQIIYVNDVYKQRFLHGVPGLAENLDQLIDTLAQYIHGKQLSVIGVSSGGIAAAHAAERLYAHKVALFSPSFEFKGVPAIDQPHHLKHENSRVYFSDSNELDGTLIQQWRTVENLISINTIDTEMHNSAIALLAKGQYQAMLEWLGL